MEAQRMETRMRTRMLSIRPLVDPSGAEQIPYVLPQLRNFDAAPASPRRLLGDVC